MSKVYEITAKYVFNGAYYNYCFTETNKRKAVATAVDIFNKTLSLAGVIWFNRPTVEKKVDGNIVATFKLPGGRLMPIVTGDWGAREWER